MKTSKEMSFFKMEISSGEGEAAAAAAAARSECDPQLCCRVKDEQDDAARSDGKELNHLHVKAASTTAHSSSNVRQRFRRRKKSNLVHFQSQFGPPRDALRRVFVVVGESGRMQ